MLRFLMFAGMGIFLTACVSKPSYQHVHCFASTEQASTIGQEIYYAGFNQQVANRLGMPTDAAIVGLGLAWNGFDSAPYCDAGAPLVVIYEPPTAKHDPEQVMFWSKVILTEMLKQRGYSDI
ncbi:hypothetical protein ACQ5ES_10885 [Pseudidiomarina sp. E22-M8]|uniref:hypothetical protein n=1 Tax=Pseudidiomarina sp. E22-M8 TaxID=3424768 RepID=UPI00403D1138